MVVGSALAHVGALGLVLFSPGDHDHEPPRVISVELVEPAPAAAPAAAPKAAPAPPPEAAPEPPPPPPPPKPKTVVLPENPTAPKPQPKQKPKPKPSEEVFKEPPKKQEKSLEDLLAEMRGSDPMAPAPAPTAGEAVDTAVVPSPGPSQGSGDPLSPEEMAWHTAVKRKMRDNWMLNPGFRTQPLVTRVVVSLDADGNILGTPVIKQKSGNPWYDESVIRGLMKASPLPRPPDAGDWPMQFEPGDSL